MRIFIGIEIPESIKKEIKIEANKFLNFTTSSRPVPESNYHVTLRYLGQVEEKELDGLYKVLSETFKAYPGFKMQLKDLGSFSHHSKHILWMGVKQGVGYLKEMYKMIDPKLKEMFDLEDNRFTPHVTLAKHVVVDDIDVFRLNKTRMFEFPIHELVVYLSHTVDDKLTYTPLKTIVLRKAEHD